MDSKPFYASKTLWVNAIALLASLTAGFGLDLGLTPEIQASLVGGIMAVVNMILRVWTTKAIRRA